MEDLSTLAGNAFDNVAGLLAVVGFLFLWRCIRENREAEREKLARYARGDYSPQNEKGRPPT